MVELVKKSGARLSNRQHVGRYAIVARSLSGAKLSEDAQKKVTNFLNAFEVEKKSYDVVKASPFTEDMTRERKICTKIFRIICSTVDRKLLADDAAVVAHAERMNKLNGSMPIVSSLKLGESFGSIEEYFEKINTDYADAVTALGVDADLKDMESHFDKMKVVYSERAIEKAGALPMTVARQNTEKAYWSMAKVLNGNVDTSADADGAYTQVVENISCALRDWDATYDMAEHKRKAKRKKEKLSPDSKKETPENNEAPKDKKEEPGDKADATQLNPADEHKDDKPDNEQPEGVNDKGNDEPTPSDNNGSGDLKPAL
jgi:hypothetical protein